MLFDAEFHEAITQIPAPSDDLKGKVIDCIEKGYKLGDKLFVIQSSIGHKFSRCLFDSRRQIKRFNQY